MDDLQSLDHALRHRRAVLHGEVIIPEKFAIAAWRVHAVDETAIPGRTRA